jgi:prolyl-tRNA synthetase
MATSRRPVLTPRADDFPRWYQEILEKAQLAENGPVRGTMVIRPYGYALWEHIQAEVDRRIKRAGAQNVYLPLFIPQDYLRREAEHVEGFSPELAVVTHAGGRRLAEPLVVRPTSETVFGELMARWVQSHRDLPMLLNQWANVVRWELRPRLFLRTSEFLWQEGHTAHATREEAAGYARRIHLEVYRDVLRSELALPVLVGFKTARERFAGAINTMTCEAMMGDGKALQVATSHELGQNFARAFGIGFPDPAGGRRLCWTTSWGSSTRLVGGLIMGHGDDHGLRVPPRVAPVQVVVLAVRDEPGVREAVAGLRDRLDAAGVRVRLDGETDRGFGRRVTDQELRGVPVRVEIGPRDLASGQVGVLRRDTGERRDVPLGTADTVVAGLLETVQRDMLAAAEDRLAARTADTASLDEAREAARTGFARIPWRLLGEDGERALAADAITVRCLQTPGGDLPGPDGGADPDLLAVVGRSY